MRLCRAPTQTKIMMSKAVAAGVGALAIQIFSGLAPSRAAWGWTMDVPTNGGFTCEEGSTIGGAKGTTAANYTCTVVPDSGMSCDVSTIYLQCSDGDGGPQNFVPVEGQCINKESAAASRNATPDTLSWSQVPACSTSGASTSSTMMGCALATFLAGMAM